MQIHQRAVAHDLRLVSFDKADAAHVRGQSVNVIDLAGSLDTVLQLRQI